jgi:hypothetical protein
VHVELVVYRRGKFVRLKAVKMAQMGTVPALLVMIVRLKQRREKRLCHLQFLTGFHLNQSVRISS